MRKEIYAAKLATGSFIGLMMGFSPNRIELGLRRCNPECDPKLINKMLTVAVNDFKEWGDYVNESLEAQF